MNRALEGSFGAETPTVIALVALVVAIAALIATIWQVLRTEGLTPRERWEISSTWSRMVVDGRKTDDFTMRPAKDFGAFFVRPGAWGSARIESFENPVGSPAGEYQIRVSWEAGDATAYVGLIYYTSSVFLRKRIARAVRVRCRPTVVPADDSGSEMPAALRPVEYWRYRWYRVFLPRNSTRVGYWHLHEPRHRQAELPAAAQPDSKYTLQGKAETL